MGMGLGVQTLNPQHLVTEKTNQLTTMDINSKSEFIYFMQRACEDQSNDCYIELYNILLRAFVCADCDFDGQVSEDEFGGMINAAAALPKKFGFDWWQGSPSDQFKAIDENGDGAVSFDEWLSFAYITTRARPCQLHLTRQTRMPLSPTARRLETRPPRATRRSTGSAGSASRQLMRIAMDRCPETSLRQ